MEWTLDGRGTLQAQLARALRQLMAKGGLRPGEPIPGTRALALELGISRTTVLQAVDQLISEGYLEARLGAGTYVTRGVQSFGSEKSPRARAVCRPRLSRAGKRLANALESVLSDHRLSKTPQRLDFRYSLGRAQDFPLAAWRRALAGAARRLGKDGFRYPSVQGSLALRRALAGYLERARGLSAHEDELVIVGGSQQGLDLAARVLLDPGDVAVLENPHYPGARLTLRAQGAKLVAVRADSEGLDPTRLSQESVAARVAHVTPSHQFPLGGVMPLGRRMALLAWAGKCNAIVLEDDYNSEFRLEGRPIEPLLNLDREGRVLYLGTFSKALMPSLRLGFSIVPEALRSTFIVGKLIADHGRPLLEQEALADFIEDGSFERHVRRVRRRQRERRRVLLEAVERYCGGSVRVHGGAGGLHVVLELGDLQPKEVPAVVARAAARGVGVYDLATHFHGRPRFAGLLLGTASLDCDEIAEGIKLLSGALGR